MSDEDLLAKATKSTKRKVGAIAVAILVAVATMSAIFLLRRTPREALSDARSIIDASRARYCEIYRDVRAHQDRPTQIHPMDDEIVLPGMSAITTGIGRPRPDANADAVMVADLASLCETPDPRRGPRLFASVLVELAASRGASNLDTYSVDGIDEALRVVRELRFLLIFVPDAATDSVITDEHTFVGGAISGTLLLYTVRDARCVLALDVSMPAPRRQTVEVTQYGSKAQKLSDAQRSLENANNVFYRELLRRQLAEHGIRLITN